jgi:hypothetical protein
MRVQFPVGTEIFLFSAISSQALGGIPPLPHASLWRGMKRYLYYALVKVTVKM